MFRKGLVFGIIVLFVGINISQITISLLAEKKVTTEYTKEDYQNLYKNFK